MKKLVLLGLLAPSFVFAGEDCLIEFCELKGDWSKYKTFAHEVCEKFSLGDELDFIDCNGVTRKVKVTLKITKDRVTE